jgi:hypothetical protein
LDFYVFQGMAGDIVTAEIRADRDGSYLNSELTLYDSTGIALAFNNDIASSNWDSRVTLTLPAEGAYYLQVEDHNGYGRPHLWYRLLLYEGSIPSSDTGFEQEPNDDFATATTVSYGDRLYGVIDADFSEPQRNVYLDDSTPGQVAITWYDLPEYPDVGSNTARAVLYEDGRIQFGFNGITAPGGLVGVSPSNGLAPLELDYTADTPVGGAGVAVFELFDDPATHPFDLDGGVIDFTPNPGGGFDVEISGIGTASEASIVGRSKVGYVATPPPAGTVRGQVMPDGATQLAGHVLVVTSSGDPTYRAELVTDSYGRFEVHTVPTGGVRAVLRTTDGREWRAAGLLTADSTLELKPRPAEPDRLGHRREKLRR